MVYLYSGLLCSSGKELSLILCTNMEAFQYILYWWEKKEIAEENLQYDTTYAKNVCVYLCK